MPDVGLKMKTIKTQIVIALLFTFPLFGEIHSAEEVKLVEDEINNYTEKRLFEEDEFKKAVVYISNITRGDIDGDGDSDAIVDYSLQGIGGGGNFSLCFQALFLREKKGLLFKSEKPNGTFGTAKGRTLSVKTIKKGLAFCDYVEWAPDDGVCCPSIKGETTLLYKNGKLIDQDSTSSNNVVQPTRPPNDRAADH